MPRRFSEIIKKLDITKVVKDTTLVKPQTINKVREIKKIQETFVLEPVLYNIGETPTGKLPQLVAQWNATASNDFSIINAKDFYLSTFSIYMMNITMMIKYRIGTDVFRYNLGKFLINPLITGYFERYTTQRIKKNFCIEMWQITSTHPIIAPFVGIINPFVTAAQQFTVPNPFRMRFVTSILVNPSSPDELEVAKSPLDTLSISNIEFPNNPVDLPIIKTNVAWLNN